MTDSEKIHELNTEIQRLAKKSYYSSYAGYGATAMGLLGGAIALLVITKTGASADVLTSFNNVHIPAPVAQALGNIASASNELNNTAGSGHDAFEPAVSQLTGVLGSKVFMGFGIISALVAGAMTALGDESIKRLGSIGLAVGIMTVAGGIVSNMTAPTLNSSELTVQEQIDSALADGDWGKARKILAPVATQPQLAYLQAQVDYLKSAKDSSAIKKDLLPLTSLPPAAMSWADKGHLYAMEVAAFGAPVSQSAKLHVTTTSLVKAQKDESLKKVSAGAAALLLIGAGLVGFGLMLRRRVKRMTEMASSLGLYTVKARIAESGFKPKDAQPVAYTAQQEKAHKAPTQATSSTVTTDNTGIDLLATAMIVNAISEGANRTDSAQDNQCFAPDSTPAAENDCGFDSTTSD